MAQRFYKIDLKGAVFPMLSSQQTRTIIGSTAGEAPAASDRPSVAYCHNVMPTKYGLDSIGYLQAVDSASDSGVLPVGRSFTDVRVVYGSERTRIYLAWDTEGSVYALLQGVTAWIALPPTAPTVTGGAGFNADSDITVSTVNGVSYIFYTRLAAFTYDEDTNALVEVTFTGLNLPDILGMVASSGYLIAYSEEAIAWSSTILSTDFVPDKVTGAGGGNVAGIAGAVLFVTSNSLGILVYTKANVLAGTYTGNSQFPFKFREVPNSKGGINLDRVAYEANSQNQFVYSKAGLQSVTSQKAENILPEVTDFLAGKILEDYNEVTKLYEETVLAESETMIKKIKYIASRYLVISYGLPSTGFTHALVFDVTLSRLGKIRLAHMDVFEYVAGQTEISKEAIAFAKADGSVQLLDFSPLQAAGDVGVLILGKLQFVRSRMFSLLGVEVETVAQGAELAVSTQVSLDGKTFTVTEGTERYVADGIREYYFRSTAKNQSLALIGQFKGTTVQVRYSTAGKR